jgi:hypothetical protein
MISVLVLIVIVGQDFWQYVYDKLGDGEDISWSDKKLIGQLCIGKTWIDLIPKGFVVSYGYIYNCVKGLNCEDADVIER